MKTWAIRKGVEKKLPEGPGVYLYYDFEGKVIYVGMSNNLVSRVGSYFGKQIVGKTRKMMDKAKRIGIIRTDSELEAILLEAKLVKKYLPKYNAALRDDKSPLFIVVTKEEWPRILTKRKSEIERIKVKKVFGPYVNGGKGREVLREIRKVFPYSQHRPGKRVCINRQIGLCKPCPSEIIREKDKFEKEKLKKRYFENVRQVEMILEGKAKRVKNNLRVSVAEFSKGEKYEKAREKWEQWEGLMKITKPRIKTELYLENPNLVDEIRKEEERELWKILKEFKIIKRIRRIECFDVAHLAGTHPTASMVTFIDGEADKRYYRHFKIRNLKRADDLEAINEVIKRRKKYFEAWGKPDLIIVDGGRGQVEAAIRELGQEICVIGLAKRDESLVIKTNEIFIRVRLPEGAAKNLVKRMRDEAHRFARRYHHLLIKRELVGVVNRKVGSEQ